MTRVIRIGSYPCRKCGKILSRGCTRARHELSCKGGSQQSALSDQPSARRFHPPQAGKRSAQRSSRPSPRVGDLFRSLADACDREIETARRTLENLKSFFAAAKKLRLEYIRRCAQLRKLSARIAVEERAGRELTLAGDDADA